MNQWEWSWKNIWYMNKWIRENLFGDALYLPFSRQCTS